MDSSEQRRRQNIADNKRILAEIGLINPFKNTPRLVLKKSGLKRKADHELPRQRKRPLLEENVDHSNRGSVMGARRRSARLQGDASGEGSQFMQLEDDFDEEEVENRRVEKNRPNHYGAISDVEVGASWYTRMECCRDGVHRPTVAGIHAGADGAYSIALSGGYDDNVDYGECFTYTGEGGRDLKGTKNNPKNLRTAPQSKNQTLTRGNLALSRNVETGNPVRVIRGYKLTSAFAPEEGYRYDGLYTVEKAWYTGGTSGFMVWKFALKRCDDQAQPSWEFTDELNTSDPEKTEEKSEKNEKEEESKGNKDNTENGTKEKPEEMDHKENSNMDKASEEAEQNDEDTKTLKELEQDKDSSDLVEKKEEIKGNETATEDKERSKEVEQETETYVDGGDDTTTDKVKETENYLETEQEVVSSYVDNDVEGIRDIEAGTKDTEKIVQDVENGNVDNTEENVNSKVALMTEVSHDSKEAMKDNEHCKEENAQQDEVVDKNTSEEMHGDKSAVRDDKEEEEKVSLE